MSNEESLLFENFILDDREETKPIIKNDTPDEETKVDNNLIDIQNNQQELKNKRNPDHREIVEYIMDLEGAKAELDAIKADQEKERHVNRNNIQKYCGNNSQAELDVVIMITTPSCEDYLPITSQE